MAPEVFISESELLFSHSNHRLLTPNSDMIGQHDSGYKLKPQCFQYRHIGPSISAFICRLGLGRQKGGVVNTHLIIPECRGSNRLRSTAPYKASKQSYNTLCQILHAYDCSFVSDDSK